MNLTQMKNTMLAALAVAGSAVAQALGGWDVALKVLICFMALDYVTGKSILKLLQDTCRQQGMTVVVITHNSAIAPMADQVIHVKNGRVERIDHNDRPVPVETIEW